MAIVSSHTLNSVDGSHAGGIKVRLSNTDTGETLFETAVDDGGRLLQDVPTPDPHARYELVFETGPYWDARTAQSHGIRIMDEIVIRFSMPDAEGRYHMPLILAPHGYSTWSSTQYG